MTLAIAWLRQDLRLADNPLLQFETPPRQLLCVYVLDPAWLEPLPGLEVPRIGPARLAFLWQSLIALRGELLRRGSDLLVRVGDPVEVVAGLAERHGACQVRVRRDAGSDEAAAVVALAGRLGDRVELLQLEGGLLFDEAALPMAVEALPPSFSAFRRRVEGRVPIPAASAAPVTLPHWPDEAPRGLPPLRDICDEAARWRPDERGGFRFAGGEAEGLARLEHYLWDTGAVGRYKETRNGLRGADFSTRLSPWLAQGCLSARQVHDAVRAWQAEHGAGESSDWVIFELLWRDFFHWAARQEGRGLFGARSLPAPGTAFRAWAAARTGVPFIDAAMHELSATGWLSNRARQNVASFLVKDLGGDWRLGAAWFEHCLVDFDVASNWGNWRYVAGVGRDTRERWFHVLRQAEQYDARGDYVAHWQPALAELPEGQARHQPWRVEPERFPLPLVVPARWQDSLLPLHETAEPDE
ncbi:deoxyribodipyrimidine photo-lyase [Halomonas campaniensis]|uniref:Cryptochrome DASH n=1 Tax=Halomonas campaniensis TaxID=213554 RepID=A0A7W5K1E8_9GAMM|nr:DASH family cryptochrome [Halomonas campaniensis]MBB3330179.1 deoxyribodipyrimidine photo-lyase [Halomonas campaniensis]